MSKTKFINQVAEMLKATLPGTVTNEELRNCYLHQLPIDFTGKINITVNELKEAAAIANIKVKGHSRLQINVSLKEQLKYMHEANPSTDREGLKKVILKDKDKIIALYLSGYSTAKISKSYGCCATTIKTYLDKWGVKLRYKGEGKKWKI